MSRTTLARPATLPALVPMMLLLTALLMAGLALARPAAAAAPESQGWWWRAQSGVLVAVPAPPQVPPGHLYVEGAPDGPTAVSALRFRVAPGEEGVALVLKVAEEQGGEGAVLFACPAEGSWVPATAGRWDDRPAAACDGQGVLGQRAEDGSAWTFPLTLAPATDLREYVLVPGTDDTRPQGLNGAVFSVTFAPPDQGTLVTRPSGFAQQPPDTTFRPQPPPDFGGTPFVSTPPAATPGVWPEAPEPAPAAPDPSVISPRVTPPAAVTGAQPVNKDARALATLIALLSVGVAGVLSRDRAIVVPGMRPAKPLDPAEDRLGGVGRFRRPRSEPPPPL